MPGIDDAGMYRPDRDLVQSFALCRQKRVGIAGRRRGSRCGERLTYAPAPVIEPAPVIGKSLGCQPEQVADGALETHGRRMSLTNRREAGFGTFKADHRDIGCLSVEQG